MNIFELQGGERKTITVEKSKTGGEDFVVSYSLDNMSPVMLSKMRSMDEKTVEEDAVRGILLLMDMEWNLKGPRVATEADVKDGNFIVNDKNPDLPWFKGNDGKLVMEPIPATWDGMGRVSLPILFRALQAIQGDSNTAPKGPKKKRR